jgi:hypothetical protein
VIRPYMCSFVRLKGYGCHIELTEEAKARGRLAPWGEGNEVAFGGLLPELTHGFHLGGSNSGICEFTGLFLVLASIDADPVLRAMFQTVQVIVELDNLECVIALNTGSVGGGGTLVKSSLLLAVLNFAYQWQCRFHFRHVAGVLNKADAPSRVELYAGTRLCRKTLAWLWSNNPGGAFTMDAMASHATAFVPPGYEGYREPERYLAYYSLSYDPCSAGRGVFTQDVAERAGVREYMYVNPPHALARAVVTYFAEARARALFVLPLLPEPLPFWWQEYVVRYSTWTSVLPMSCSEYRRNGGWWPCERPLAQVACILDFTECKIGEYVERAREFRTLQTH